MAIQAWKTMREMRQERKRPERKVNIEKAATSLMQKLKEQKKSKKPLPEEGRYSFPRATGRLQTIIGLQS